MYLAHTCTAHECVYMPSTYLCAYAWYKHTRLRARSLGSIQEGYQREDTHSHTHTHTSDMRAWVSKTCMRMCVCVQECACVHKRYKRRSRLEEFKMSIAGLSVCT